MPNDFDVFRQQAGVSAPSKPVDDFDVFRQQSGMNLSTSDIAKEVGMQVAAGAVETAPSAIGLVGGLKAGAALGTAVLPGLGTAIGAGLGGITGFGLGLWAGGEAKEQMQEYGAVTPIEDLPEGIRPYAVGGETFGRVLGGMTTPLGLAKAGLYTQGKTAVGRWYNMVLDTAAKSPVKTLAIETGMGAGSATGAAVAEAFVPGSEGARFVGEVMGGLVNPTNVVHGTWKTAKGTWDRGKQMFSVRAQEDRVMQHIVNIMDEFGDDPKLAAQLIREYAGEANLTTAQKTGMTSLAAIEKTLGANFKAAAGEESEVAFQLMRDLMTHMTETGDPAVLQTVAKMRREYIRGVLATKVAIVERKAQDAIRNITKDTPDMRIELSRNAAKSMQGALDDARAMERQLWSEVPKDLPASADTFISVYKDVQETLGKAGADRIPGKAKEFMSTLKSYAQTGDPVPVKDLIDYRSELLEVARESMMGDKPNRKMAMAAGRLAESLLDDLDTAMVEDVSYDIARTFSKEMHDTFTRSFVGKVNASGVRGQRVPPELLLQKAMAGGADARVLQMNELLDATEFMVKNAPDDVARVMSQQQFDTMLETQESMLRLTAMQAVDYTPDGVARSVNPSKMRKWLDDNTELFKRFPGVRQHLEDAMASENSRQAMVDMVNGKFKSIDSRTFLGKLYNGNPVAIVGKAVMGETAEKDIKSLARIAKRSGDDRAIPALRSAVLESVLKGSTGNDGVTINLATAFGKLTKPPIGSKKSVLEMMVDEGVMDSNHVKQIQVLADEYMRITKAGKTKARVEEMEEVSGVLSNLMLKISGSAVGTTAASMVGSKSTIIAAGAGSKAATNIFEKLPSAKLQTVLADIMSDPDRFAKLLERAPTAAKQMEKTRQFHTYLITSGILTMPDVLDDTPAPEFSESLMSVL